jgi:hypothetical protein
MYGFPALSCLRKGKRERRDKYRRFTLPQTCKRRQHKAQSKQDKRRMKNKRGNRYVIKVTRLNREGGTVPLVRENQRLSQAFSLVHN